MSEREDIFCLKNRTEESFWREFAPSPPIVPAKSFLLFAPPSTVPSWSRPGRSISCARGRGKKNRSKWVRSTMIVRPPRGLNWSRRVIMRELGQEGEGGGKACLLVSILRRWGLFLHDAASQGCHPAAGVADSLASGVAAQAIFQEAICKKPLLFRPTLKEDAGLNNVGPGSVKTWHPDSIPECWYISARSCGCPGGNPVRPPRQQVCRLSVCLSVCPSVCLSVRVVACRISVCRSREDVDSSFSHTHAQVQVPFSRGLFSLSLFVQRAKQKKKTGEKREEIEEIWRNRALNENRGEDFFPPLLDDIVAPTPPSGEHDKFPLPLLIVVFVFVFCLVGFCCFPDKSPVCTGSIVRRHLFPCSSPNRQLLQSLFVQGQAKKTKKSAKPDKIHFVSPIKANNIRQLRVVFF